MIDAAMLGILYGAVGLFAFGAVMYLAAVLVESAMKIRGKSASAAPPAGLQRSQPDRE